MSSSRPPPSSERTVRDPAVEEDDSGSDGQPGRHRHWSAPKPVLFEPPKSLAPRFRVHELVGVGGTSLVYLATDRDLQREVAVKVLREELASDPEQREAFLREARLTARLAHAGVVPVHEVDQHAAAPYIVMRYVHGESLGALIRKARAQVDSEVLPLHELLNVFSKVCGALAFAHAKGIVHQDVKPDNIVIGEYGEVVLVDWGAASQSARESETAVGTPHYMAPERVQGDPPTAAVDIYGLGVSMFYALVLRRPFEGVKGDEFWRRLVAGEMVPLTTEERRRVPSELLAIVLEALRTEPADRFASIVELSRELSNFQAGRHAWASPLVVETFTERWEDRWKIPVGEFECRDGALITVSEGQATALYHQRLFAGVAIEFEGEMLSGHRPGDLSVLWTENEPDASPRGDFLTGFGRTYGVQAGAFANTLAGVLRKFPSHSSFEVAVPYELDVGRRYTIRTELDVRVLRLFVNGVLVCQHELLMPLRSGYVGLLGHYSGKAFRNVRIFTRGIPERVSPIVAGDVLFERDHLEEALAQYREIAAAFAGRLLGDEAGYKAGLCLYRLGRKQEAFDRWGSLEEPRYQTYATMHEFVERLGRGEHEAVASEFRARYRTSPELQASLRTGWVWCTDALLEVDAKALSVFVDLRNELFPDDRTTAAMVATALDRCGRWEEIVSSFTQYDVEVATAMMDLGRPEEAFERCTLSFVRSAALLMLGRLDELEPGAELGEYALLLSGHLEEALARSPREPELLLALGRNDDVLGCADTGHECAATALRRLGRLDEAAATGDLRSLLFAKRYDEALAKATFPEHIWRVLPYGMLTAFKDGRRDEYRRLRDEVFATPFSWRWDSVWFARCLMDPFLAWLDGDTDAMQRACATLMATRRNVHVQKLWYISRYLVGEMDEAEFCRQPGKYLLRPRLLIASALRAELMGNTARAHESYSAFMALPPHEQSIHQAVDDPVLSAFVEWRREVTGRGLARR